MVCSCVYERLFCVALLRNNYDVATLFDNIEFFTDNDPPTFRFPAKFSFRPRKSPFGRHGPAEKAKEYTMRSLLVKAAIFMVAMVMLAGCVYGQQTGQVEEVVYPDTVNPSGDNTPMDTYQPSVDEIGELPTYDEKPAPRNNTPAPTASPKHGNNLPPKATPPVSTGKTPDMEPKTAEQPELEGADTTLLGKALKTLEAGFGLLRRKVNAQQKEIDDLQVHDKDQDSRLNIQSGRINGQNERIKTLEGVVNGTKKVPGLREQVYGSDRTPGLIPEVKSLKDTVNGNGTEDNPGLLASIEKVRRTASSFAGQINLLFIVEMFLVVGVFVVIIWLLKLAKRAPMITKGDVDYIAKIAAGRAKESLKKELAAAAHEPEAGLHEETIFTLPTEPPAPPEAEPEGGTGLEVPAFARREPETAPVGGGSTFRERLAARRRGGGE